MPMYPPAVTGTESADLYATHTTRKYPLGTIAQFKTSNGIVTARYVGNEYTVAASSLAAGQVVAHGNAGYVNSHNINHASMNANLIAGGLAASLSTGNYGWAIFLGPQTGAIFGATLATSASHRALMANSLGQLTTVATNATTNLARGPVALLRSTSVTVATAAGGAAIVDWIWR